MRIEFELNGRRESVDVPEDMPLLWILRDVLDRTGTKFGCGRALCGACTVHVDGGAVRSCAFPAQAVNGKKVTTIEGLEESPVGQAVVEAWIEHDVVQCGWCQPGQCMSAAALLSAESRPDDTAIDNAMSGNICRCGAYPRIKEAIHLAAGKLAEGDGR